MKRLAKGGKFLASRAGMKIITIPTALVRRAGLHKSTLLCALSEGERRNHIKGPKEMEALRASGVSPSAVYLKCEAGVSALLPHTSGREKEMIIFLSASRLTSP